MNIQDPIREGLDERWRNLSHETSQGNEIHLAIMKDCQEADSPVFGGTVNDRIRDTHGPSTGYDAGLRPAGYTQCNPRWYATVSACVSYGLEVGTSSRSEYRNIHAAWKNGSWFVALSKRKPTKPACRRHVRSMKCGYFCRHLPLYLLHGGQGYGRCSGGALTGSVFPEA